MTATPDPARVADSFSAAAATYDAAAGVQRRAAAHLIGLLPRSAAPAHVVDLGCGTGLLTRDVMRVWPDARLTGIDLAPGMLARCRATGTGHAFTCGDLATAAPPADMDAVVTSFALHWLADGPAALGRWVAALPPGGLAAAAVPVAGSLADLARAYRRATGRPFPGLRYTGSPAYLDAVRSAGGTVRASETVRLDQPCASPVEALRTLRELGATARPADAGPPAGAGALRRALAAFAGSDGRAALQFEVLFVVAERAA